MEKQRKGIYYRLIWKKGFLILPRFLTTLVITALVLALASILIYHVMQKRQSLLPRVQVAVVVLDGDVATGMTVRMVSEIETIKNVCDIKIMSRSAAETAIREGSVQAAVYLTEDLYHDFASGTNTPILVQVTKDSGLGVQRFRDLVEVALSLLHTGQSTIFTLDDITAKYPMKISVQDLKDTLADDYVSLALNRNLVWNSTVLSAFDPVTTMNYYSVTAALFIICLFFGTGFAALYDKKERSVDICLGRMGIGPVTKSAARLLIMTFVSWLVLIVVLIPSYLITTKTGIHAATVFWIIPGTLPAAFCTAAFIHLVNACAVGESGSLFYLIVCLLLFVIGGGLFPAVYLPPVLAKFAGYLPISLWQQYLTELLWNGFSAVTLVRILAAGLVMAVIGGIGMRYHEGR